MADTDIKFRVSQTGAEKTAQDFKNVENSFDGLNVTSVDLHERLADLDSQMRTLIATQGKMAYESQQGVRIQRERKLALTELLSIQEDETESVKRSVRGFGSLTSAALSATGSISGMGTATSILTNSLMSGAGLTAGLAAIVAGFSALMSIIRETREETEKMKEEISGLLEIQGPGGKFKIAPDKLPEAISKLKSDLDYYFKTMSEGTRRGEFLPKGTEDTWKGLLVVLEEANEKYQQQLKYIEALQRAGFIYTEKETKALEKKNKELSKWNRETGNIFTGNINNQGLNPDAFQFRTDLLGGFDFSREELLNMQQNAEEMKRQTEEHFNMIQDLSLISANILREEFTEAWQSIFGEANSLFEKFAMRISEYFVNLALQKAAFGLFNLIFPGAGTVGDLAFGKSSPSGGSSTFNLILDGEKVGEFVDRRVPYSVNRAVRLNVL